MGGRPPAPAPPLWRRRCCLGRYILGKIATCASLNHTCPGVLIILYCAFVLLGCRRNVEFSLWKSLKVLKQSLNLGNTVWTMSLMHYAIVTENYLCVLLSYIRVCICLGSLARRSALAAPVNVLPFCQFRMSWDNFMYVWCRRTCRIILENVVMRY